MRTPPGTRGGRLVVGWWRESVVTALSATLYVLGASGEPEEEGLMAPPLSIYPLAVVSCAVLPLRHRFPRTAVAVTTGGGVVAPPLGYEFNPLLMVPVMVALHGFALRHDSRERRTAIGWSMLVLAMSSLAFGPDSPLEAGTASTVAFPLLAGALGASTRNRRAYLTAVEERARRAEETRESEARRRVVEERVRIARELHDVVAHHMTLVHAQASVVALFFDSQPEEARESLSRLTENTSNALDELRATVGLLRETGDPGAPLDPPPGLDQLPALADSFRAAGLEVTVSSSGPARALSPAVDLTAFRIVQEALTNVAKHAGTGAARIDLAYRQSRLTLTVVNEEGRAAPAADRPPGYGLIGMRERAAAVGGRLSAGPRPEGGFLVTAELPLPSGRDSGPGASGDGRAEQRDGAQAPGGEAAP